MPKVNSSFKFGVAITFIIIFLIMFVVTLVMFWIPVSAAEKPISIMKQTSTENQLIVQERFEYIFISRPFSDETQDAITHSPPLAA